jgi:predicted nucleic acid-binding protein
MTYALDSNIIAYMLKDSAAVYEHVYSVLDNNDRCIIPPIVYYEVKRGLLAVNATAKAQSFELLCREFSVGRMNVNAWDIAAQLYAAHRQKGMPIGDADSFIAAFCIANGYTLVTNNTKHFVGIDNLRLVDWTRE